MAEPGRASLPPVTGDLPVQGTPYEPPSTVETIRRALAQLLGYASGDPNVSSTGSSTGDLLGAIPRSLGSGIRQVAHGDLQSGDPEQVTRAMYNLAGGAGGTVTGGVRGLTAPATKLGARLLPAVPDVEFKPSNIGKPWQEGQPRTVKEALDYIAAIKSPVANEMADRLRQAHPRRDVPVHLREAEFEGHRLGPNDAVTSFWEDPPFLRRMLPKDEPSLTPARVSLHPEQSFEGAVRNLAHEGTHVSFSDPRVFPKRDADLHYKDALRTIDPRVRQQIENIYPKGQHREELIARYLEEQFWKSRQTDDPAYLESIRQLLQPSRLPRAASPPPPPLR